VRRYYLVPSATTAAAGESPALDVLAQLMGGGSNSYLGFFYRPAACDRPAARDSDRRSLPGHRARRYAFTISASPNPA